MVWHCLTSVTAARPPTTWVAILAMLGFAFLNLRCLHTFLELVSRSQLHYSQPLALSPHRTCLLASARPHHGLSCAQAQSELRLWNRQEGRSQRVQLKNKARSTFERIAKQKDKNERGQNEAKINFEYLHWRSVSAWCAWRGRGLFQSGASCQYDLSCTRTPTASSTGQYKLPSQL